MRVVSLMCLLSACALVAEGCSGGGANSGTGGVGTGTGGGSAGGVGAGSGGQGTGGTGGSAGTTGSGTGGNGTGGDGTGGDGTGGKGGAAGSGTAGKAGAGGAAAGGAGGAAGKGAGGANGGASGTAGSSCQMQSVAGTDACRSPADCTTNPINVQNYDCETTVVTQCPTPYCGSVSGTRCTVDTDCPTNDICITVKVPCCSQTAKICHLSCNAPGVGCAADAVCSPGTKGADDYGCVPVPCNAGYTCPSRSACQIGSAAADGHGCVKLPCSQVDCPANFVCMASGTTEWCAPKSCATDCNCDSAFCVDGLCSSVLGTCVTIIK